MGLIYLYTGDGGGKTTSALGVAFRSLGHNHKVVVIQFMKGRRDTGECLIKKKLAPNYQIYQFGRKEFVNLNAPAKIDKNLASRGLKFAEKILKTAPNLLVLDEINIAAAAGLVKVNDVLKLLKKVPEKTSVYLTGRYAPQELIDRADFATKIEDLKRPKKYTGLHEGIEY